MPEPPPARGRLTVGVTLDGIRASISRPTVGRLTEFVLRSERVRDALVSITFVSSRAIARLNSVHLGHRGATDVISFGFRDARGPARPVVVADVYIAPEIAARNAKRFGVRVRDELARLVVHGTLHALGWNHPEGAAREASPMWARQELLLKRWQRRTAQ